ncbi:MAG: hypothetical protein GF372_12355 [Candidatus Marinimicrobia bacterium]|nr:hypothetical protein [Candidatus Neomarinimicrobiota bacterium]
MFNRCNSYKLAAVALWLVILIFSSCSTPTSSNLDLEVTQSELDFGLSLRSLNLHLHNHSDQTLNWTVVSHPAWISLNQSEGDLSGHDREDLQVSLNRFQLSDGKHTGTISLNAGDESRTVKVTCSVSGPYLYVYESEIDFGCETESVTLSLENIGNESTRYETENTSEWLIINPTQGRIGEEPVEMTVRVKRDTSKHEFNVPYSGTIKFIPENPEYHVEELDVLMEVPNPYT